jgi:predicted ribosome quality control (RQC) complex YloA/Tae2 family protein
MKKSFSSFLILSSLISCSLSSWAANSPAEPHESLEWFELMQDWLDNKVDESTIELHEEMDKTLETAEKTKEEVRKDIEKTKKKNQEKRAELKKKKEAHREKLKKELNAGKELRAD